MGGDNAPAAAVGGAIRFARAQPEHKVFLVGDEARLRPLLASGSAPANVELRHASESIDMTDDAIPAIRKKRDSSMRVGLELLKTGEVDAMVSAGHSGAMMAGALFVLGRLPHVERPAIGALLPGPPGTRGWLLLDAGANVQCRPTHLVQFAVMGEAYVQRRFGIARPRVALLSNGEEDTKGTDLTREALALLRRSDLNLVGYLEGKDLFLGMADVVVTDGFTGNVVLKTSEGTAMALVSRLRAELAGAPVWRKLGALLLRPAFEQVRQMGDYAEYGGAPLLGVHGVALIAHGRSSARAFHSALRAALETAQGGFMARVSERLDAAEGWLATG
jgi:glycerol-3-phosphate acyltransferase PlsX